MVQILIIYNSELGDAGSKQLIKKEFLFRWDVKFEMLTDHKPLVSPFNLDKKLPVYTFARLQGWAITLMTSNTVQQIYIVM